MLVETEEHGHIMVLSLRIPRFDGSVAEDVRAEALSAVEGRGSVILIDLSNVTFIDSTGIGTLVGMMKAVGRERRLELCALSPMVHKVFRITRLDGVFTIHRSTDEALQQHAARRAAG